VRVAILGSRGYPSTYGGFETMVRRLAPWLAQEGFDVTVYCRAPGLRPRSELVDGVRCVSTPGAETKSLSTLSFGFTAALDSLARGFDVVLVVNVANGFFLPIIQRRGVPAVVNVDGLEWERAKWSPLGRRVFKSAARVTARFARELIVDSRAIGRAWDDAFGRSGVFLPYGADVLPPRPAHRIEALGLECRRYALVVARLVPENNIALMLDALELLGDAVPAVVVGSANYDSPLEARLRGLVRSRPGFRWLGHVHDQELLADLWAHCGVYLHGHSVGGTNPALLQALGAGGPTLALDTVYNREVIGADDQLFPPDPAELAVRIKAVLGDAALQDELAGRGRERVRTDYSWEAVCEGYASVLRALAVDRTRS
jgi:glycosyltransferase involved in cell wall biosynthesis